jgi:V/A-type H+/Na+-transporting ATPase subunit D
MAQIKLTKNALRAEQNKLNQLEKYLPTLQIKKAMLQSEVVEVKQEILGLEDKFNQKHLQVSTASGLISARLGFDLFQALEVKEVVKEYENIAGVDIPLYKETRFAPFSYPLFGTPPFVDALIADLKKMVEAQCEMQVSIEKKEALERELRDVSTRVNLFEKNLIPKSQSHIKRIKVFLGDQELAAVGQAKVAKSKIEKSRLKKREAYAH